MKTISIQIGNSDNKLTQVEWAEYVGVVKEIINRFCECTHFFGGPPTYERWQNAAWVVEVSEMFVPIIKNELRQVKRLYNQDFIAWMEGEVEFV